MSVMEISSMPEARGLRRLGAKTMAMLAGVILLISFFSLTLVKNEHRYLSVILCVSGSIASTFLIAPTSASGGTVVAARKQS